MTSVEAAVTDAVRRLDAMKLEELRAEWRRRFGIPPTLRSADLLRRLLAWRIQAEVFGGLDRSTVRELISGAKKPGRRNTPTLAGSKISREWQGRLHEVEVLEEGYLYAGERFASLSAIARTITGSRWNGPKFFGLRGAEGK